MPADAATVDFAAVTSGPEAGGKRRRALRVGTWLSLGWMAFVVGGRDPGARTSHSTIREALDHRRSPGAARSPSAGTAPGHLLGGDSNGRDMLSRLLWGGRTTLVVATVAVLIGFVIGGVLGLLAATSAGRIDTIMSGLLRRVPLDPGGDPGAGAGHHPARPAATAGRATAGLDPEVALILALGIVSIPVLGRITRASTLSWSEREFVLAARAQGAKNRRIICA